MKKYAVYISICSLMLLLGSFVMKKNTVKNALNPETKQVNVSLLTVEPASRDWEVVESVFKRKGTVEEDVFKLTFPRTDLKVKVKDVNIEPGLALTTWIAFKPIVDHSLVMGDFVLLEKEVDPVITKLTASGIDVTALHNHLTGESPKIMYMHISGHGKAKELAEKIKATLELTSTPLGSTLEQKFSNSLDWSNVESIMGRKGKSKGNLIQFSFPRPNKIIEHDILIPPAMGTATAINFQSVGKKAATTGDFVLLANEVNPVIRALTRYGITVTAVHNHMLFEEPRLFFLHFWGFDDAEKLSQGLKGALEQMK